MIRYPSLARRKQVSKARDKALRDAVAGSVGFVQEPVTVEPVEAPPWPPTPPPRRVTVFDLNAWANPGASNAAIGPFLVLCGICTNHPGHFDLWDAAETAQRAHYRTHYYAGETS